MAFCETADISAILGASDIDSQLGHDLGPNKQRDVAVHISLLMEIVC